jgi:hypothetical protein
MSELLWKRMLREDPRMYRTRVAYFARKDPEALRAYLRSLPGAELLRHLEVLFAPGDSGPGEHFELTLWRSTSGDTAMLHVPGRNDVSWGEGRGLDGSEPALIAWMRRTTKERGMQPWRVWWVALSSLPRPAPEKLDEVLAAFPEVRLAEVWTRRQERYVERPGIETPAMVYAGARLEAADGGTITAELGTWPEEATAEVEGWAAETCRRHGLPRPRTGD